MALHSLHIDRLLTVPEAAEVVEVSRASIYYWMSQGVLSYIQKGAQRLIRPDALQIANKIMQSAGKKRKKEENFSKKEKNL